MATPAAAPPAAVFGGRDELLSSLNLHPRLRERINEVLYPHPHAASTCLAAGSRGETKCCGETRVASSSSSSSPSPYVLYLPTVNLRYEHNPSFALACRLANARDLHLVVLCCCLDDASTPAERSNVPASGGGNRIAMTARRLAFHLEALSQCSYEWSRHGAAVAIRVHGPGCRTPDHLTLGARKAACAAVVTDEPFCDPYLGFVQKVERACHIAGVRVFRVDGSTMVPPFAVLEKIRESGGGAAKKGGRSRDDGGGDDDGLLWWGVPAKAWMWQKKTEARRMGHLEAAMGGHFDAPPLKVKIDGSGGGSFWEEDSPSSAEQPASNDDDDDRQPSSFAANFPASWRDPSSESPGKRPWTVSELLAIANSEGGLKEWAMSWPGADPSVPPCSQTVGTSRAGMTRWNSWIHDRSGIIEYARRRNDIRQPHSSSRMSCYLNLGVVSVFRLVNEVKEVQGRGIAGADKFEEEIVKWREMSYAHAFSRADPAGAGCVPRWAMRVIDRGTGSSGSLSSLMGSRRADLDLVSLETGRTGNEKWDAMQRYLHDTGELHNNARMTWGKTLVHWGKDRRFDLTSQRVGGGSGSPTSAVLRIMCYLNDRYALDGLSPPSYAGLLWCLGWSDKPGRGGGISEKPASRYRYSAQDFNRAKAALLDESGGNGLGLGGLSSSSQGSILISVQKRPQKRQRVAEESSTTNDEQKSASDPERPNSDDDVKPGPAKKGTIRSFFAVG